MDWLKGKKTYILGVLSIVSAVAGVLTGTIDLGTAWVAIQAALASMTIRNAIPSQDQPK